MKRKQKYIVSTTHVDSHGDSMSIEALNGLVKSINGDRKIRLGLEHNRTFPPLGATMNGAIIEMEGEHYGVTAEMVFFDEQQYLTLDDGTQLAKEFFSDVVFSFKECEVSEASKLAIATDPINYGNSAELQEIYDLIKKESDIDFDTAELVRKAALPDHETIVTVTTTLALALGIIKSKVTEKVGEAIGEDIAKFYKLLSGLAIETIKKAKPSNRPKNFIIYYPNSECNIELIVSTHSADRVLKSLQKDKLEIVKEKIEQLKNFDAEMIQFIYNDDDVWEFNYLLSSDGATIGTIKSFNKRNELYNKILEKQNNDKK